MEEILPLFPLNTVLFPGMLLPIHVFEERYLRMIRDCLVEEKPFGVALIREGEEVGGPALPHLVGTTARLLKVQPQEGARVLVLARGEERFRIRELLTDLPHLQARVEPLEDTDPSEADLSRLSGDVGADFKRFMALRLSLAVPWMTDFDSPTDPHILSFSIAPRLESPPLHKQRLLELTSLRQRLQEEQEMIRREMVRLERLVLAQPTGSFGPAPS